MPRLNSVRRTVIAVLSCLALTPACRAYSVLSHEALIDALWDTKLKPALLSRYPEATPEELKKAHGYAYGGAIIQDLGYYPHGSKQFSDLTHYVRTGDFIVALVHESRSLDDLAFALGALSHYMSDVDGHRLATNVGEPILYPRLQRKFGKFITYEDSPAGHLKTEFGFDVLEVAKGRFAPEAYHNFIGFDVSQPLVERAFRDTYGLEIQDLFKDFPRAVESFRNAVSKTIPMATRIAWAEKRHEIERSEPGITRQRFVYMMSRSSYERDWGKQYDRPTAGDQMLAIVLKLVPPIGPLRAIKLRMPTPPVEKLFMDSFDRSAEQFAGTINLALDGSLRLEPKNYDVGVVTSAGAYRLDDDIQAYWLALLAGKNFATVTPAMRGELLEYYKDLKAPIATQRDAKKWRQLMAELKQLKSEPIAETAAALRR
ncbi:MAG: zinc dependent phospholipase C family protein [Acidobacteriaceae bacterium]|nr:zinc dependent phospholipase C family protein [Acidobacteriaceae bacterium]MBV9294590.1 zinc dependent phospholipase C family protein [Acidobacteriaceae bacterium]